MLNYCSSVASKMSKQARIVGTERKYEIAKDAWFLQVVSPSPKVHYIYRKSSDMLWSGQTEKYGLAKLGEFETLSSNGCQPVWYLSDRIFLKKASMSDWFFRILVR